MEDQKRHDRRNGDIAIIKLSAKLDQVLLILEERTRSIKDITDEAKTHLSIEHKAIDADLTKVKIVGWFMAAAIGGLWVIVSGVAIAVIVRWFKFG